MNTNNAMNHNKLGTLCVFMASVFFSIGGFCVKLIPWSPLAINGARSLICGLEPIMNPLWVALFYGEKMSCLSIIGGVIVVGAILWYQMPPDWRPGCS